MILSMYTSHNHKLRGYETCRKLVHKKIQSFMGNNFSTEFICKITEFLYKLCLEKPQMKITKIGKRDLEFEAQVSSEEERMSGDLNRMEMTKVEDFSKRMAT